MAATISTEEQLKFALTCFHKSSGGKVDFKAVANDLGIVTVGAAQKRWSRLNKAHGFSTSSSGSAGPDSAPSTPAPEKKTKAAAKGRAGGGASAAKKRKIQQVQEEEEEEEEEGDDDHDDDEEGDLKKGGILAEEQDNGEAYVKDEEA